MAQFIDVPPVLGICRKIGIEKSFLIKTKIINLGLNSLYFLENYPYKI